MDGWKVCVWHFKDGYWHSGCGHRVRIDPTSRHLTRCPFCNADLFVQPAGVES